MLAAVSAQVKNFVLAGPEKIAVDQALQGFWLLVEAVQDAADNRKPVHQVEQTLFGQLLVIGRQLLEVFLLKSGDGDAGPELALSAAAPDRTPTFLPRLPEKHVREYRSIFGDVRIPRVCYGRRKIEAAPLDARLGLPERMYSYVFQQWLAAFSINDAHAEAIEKLRNILGLNISVKAAEDLNVEQAASVESYRQARPRPDPKTEQELLVIAADCKGVPIVREKPDPTPPDSPAADSTSTPAEAAPSHEAKHRRGKGEKADKKKMAAVGAAYTIAPFPRTADDVIKELNREEAAERRPRPQNKLVRAELLTGKIGLFAWLAAQVVLRNRRGRKKVIYLCDGERALRDRQKEFLPEAVIAILDLFHVLEKLWQAAWCFFIEGDKDDKKRAEAWVEQRLRMLLEGKVGYVVGGLRQMLTKRDLKGKKRKTLQTVIGYFHRNRERMKYDEYLAAGYPIGSGAVEGACRHLVKDRMERTGMRWQPAGAQAMLDLRSTYLNAEWEGFWTHHITRENNRLYGRLCGKNGTGR